MFHVEHYFYLQGQISIQVLTKTTYTMDTSTQNYRLLKYSLAQSEVSVLKVFVWVSVSWPTNWTLSSI